MTRFELIDAPDFFVEIDAVRGLIRFGDETAASIMTAARTAATLAEYRAAPEFREVSAA